MLRLVLASLLALALWLLTWLLIDTWLIQAMMTSLLADWCRLFS